MVVEFDVPLEVAQAAREQAKELSFSDAAKIFTVLKITLEKLALVGVITVDQQEQALTLTKTVGEEIAALIKQQNALEKEFERLVLRQHELKNQTNRIRKEENDANIKLVAEKLRTSIGVLCGKLKDNPNVAENAAKVASERQMLQVLFGKALDELTTAKKIPCIVETVLSEQYKRREIRDVVDREKTATRAVTNLRMELHDEKEQHDKAMQAIKMCNGKLKEDIKVQNQDTYIERSHVHKQLSCRHSAECALKNQEILDLQKQLNDLQTKEQIEQQVHHAVQEQFQELQGSFQLIAASWSAQMSSDSAAKSKALEELKQKHNVVLAQFKEAQAEHTREVALKQEREKHAREAAEVAEAKRIQDECENSAAACIQAHWRGYKTRQGTKGGKDKGKKGKKKK